MQGVSKNRGYQNSAGTTVQCTPTQSAINAIIVVDESHCYHHNRSSFNFHHRHNYKRKQAIALKNKFGCSDLHENEVKIKTRNLKGIANACECAIPSQVSCISNETRCQSKFKSDGFMDIQRYLATFKSFVRFITVLLDHSRVKYEL